MAEIKFNDGSLKLVGEGHAHIAADLMTPAFLKVLISAPPESDFYLPDLFDILDKQTIDDLRKAFQTIADPETFKLYQEYLGRFAAMQVGRVWTLEDLVPVWRTKLGLALIDEIIRVKDGRAFVIITGSKELLSEHDLYRRTLKTVSEHLDSFAMDAATIAKYTKLTLAAPIVERTICVSGPAGIATIRAWGPGNLDCSQWTLPAGLTFISLES